VIRVALCGTLGWTDAAMSRATPAPVASVRRHLDLGCGQRPRNPYRCDELYGVDIRSGLSAPGVRQIVAANLAIEPIPFPDGHFDSLSAFDFLEHVPRVALDYSKGVSRLPFIELMNEVWRVLKPDGLFYAVTPVFPHEKVWRDPTHVNPLTSKSHRYFSRPELGGRMYGFTGEFELVRQVRCRFRGESAPPASGPAARLRRGLERLLGQAAHLVWEMRAIKDEDPSRTPDVRAFDAR
jgi:SAM-dependent methyltransferase